MGSPGAQCFLYFVIIHSKSAEQSASVLGSLCSVWPSKNVRGHSLSRGLLSEGERRPSLQSWCVKPQARWQACWEGSRGAPPPFPLSSDSAFLTWQLCKGCSLSLKHSSPKSLSLSFLLALHVSSLVCLALIYWRLIHYKLPPSFFFSFSWTQVISPQGAYQSQFGITYSFVGWICLMSVKIIRRFEFRILNYFISLFSA